MPISERACRPVGFVPAGVRFGLTGEGELVPKMVWRVKLVAELEPGLTTEVEIARLERDEQASLADLGLRLAEAQAGHGRAPGRDGPDAANRRWRRRPCIPTPCSRSSGFNPDPIRSHCTSTERRRLCEGCGGVLASRGSLQRDVPLPVRRRAGTGSAPARLSLPGFGRGKTLRCPQPRGGDRGA